MRKTCYEPHDYLSLWLDKVEEKYPKEIIDDFFNEYPLPDCRLYLWQMLKWYGREKDEEIILETVDCLPFFEKLVCFVEAAYLLQEREESKAEKSKEEVLTKDSSEIMVSDCNKPEDPLDPIIRMIRNSMDVEKIFLLGSYPSEPVELGMEYDLLILVRDDNNRPNDEWESLIQNRSHDLPPVYASVYTISKVNALISSGNYFFNLFCVNDKLIYDAGNTGLKMSPVTYSFPEGYAVREAHDTIMHKANGFITGAIHFYEEKEFPLAAFMLHQAAEHGFNALLAPLMQFRIQTHNLNKLIHWARRFSTDICSIFPRSTSHETSLFQVLQKAYLHARYKDTFQVSEQQVEALLERVKQLLQLVHEEFSGIVDSVNHPVTEIGA